MSITLKPATSVHIDRDTEWISTPVAFRITKRHPWRSYEPGNARYVRDYNAHMYTIVRAGVSDGEILCILISRFLGTEYETHCSACGKYAVVMLPSSCKVAPMAAQCIGCAGAWPPKAPSALYPYTPEYKDMIARRRA